MADLNSLYSSDTVKIAGADSSGLETGFVKSSSNGDLNTSDILNSSAIQTTLNVGTSAVEAKVGSSTLANRKMLIIQCQTGSMTYGFSSGSQPFTLPNGTTLSLNLGPNVSIWLRRTIGTGNVVIAELS